MTRKPSHLRQGIQIVKGGQRKGRYLWKSKVCELGSQKTVGIQARKLSMEATAVVQQAGELNCLTLRSALMETVNQLKDNWFQ